MSKLDLRDSLNNLLYAAFDNGTIWPDADRMPKTFDRKQIMEMGKNPGIGIRKLHMQGITGRGVGVAILDQALLVNHWEYADRLQLYEEINIGEKTPSQMHGPAVASIAVGKTVGVAPEAELYYIGEWNGDWENGKFTSNFKYLAQGVHRILEINQQLPKDKKIRVISMSVGWNPPQKGYREITDAVQKAKAAGILVICSSTERIHGFSFLGLGRFPSVDPDDFNSYEPGLWWAKMFYGYTHTQFRPGLKPLLVPMDSRTTSSPTGPDQYVFYRQGGLSWVIPYIAGVYALAVQVEPDITPDRFWALALKTGRTIELENKGKKMPFGPILDPLRLIDALKDGDLANKDAVTAELAKYNGTPPTPPVDSAFQAKVARLDINKATRQDVIKIFGPPLSYRRGMHHLDENNLPDRYIMFYSSMFKVYILKGHIQELRFKTPGYVFQNKIQVGSTLNDVLKVLGTPGETVVGKKNEFKDGILYRDIDGREGHCYYARADQGVRMFFMNNQVIALYVTRTKPLVPKR